MADTTISQLVELETPATDDEFSIYDVSEVSAEPTKKITYANLASAISAQTSFGFADTERNSDLSIPTSAGGTRYVKTDAGTTIMTLPDSTTWTGTTPVAFSVSAGAGLYTIKTSDTASVAIDGVEWSSYLFLGPDDTATLYPNKRVNGWYATVVRNAVYRERPTGESINFSTTPEPALFSGNASISVTNTTGTVTITLPTLSASSFADFWAYNGYTLTIRYAANGGTCVVARSGANTIDGATSKTTTTRYSSITLKALYNGGTATWIVVSQIGTWS